jgi:membrane protein
MADGRASPEGAVPHAPTAPRRARARRRPLARRAAGTWAVLRNAARTFVADGGFIMAAAISFYALLSLIPVLFLVIALAGYLLGSSQETFHVILSSVREFIPHLSDDISANLESVVANRGRISWFGLACLVIAADLVFRATEVALDRIFAVPRRRGFLRSRLLSVSMVVAMGLVLLFSFYVGVIFHTLTGAVPPAARALVAPLARGLQIQYLTSVALVALSFTLALHVLPHVRVRWRHALFGGCVGTVLWEIGRRFFLWYLANLAQFYVVYGSLGALVAVLVWIYVSVTIFLYAAECVVILHRGRV